MVSLDDLLSGRDKLSLVGLGYVGMPIAVAFARRLRVIGALYARLLANLFIVAP